MMSALSSPSMPNRTRMTSLRVLSRGKLVLHMKENALGVWETLYKSDGKKKSKKRGRGPLSKMWKKHKESLKR